MLSEDLDGVIAGTKQVQDAVTGRLGRSSAGEGES